MIKNYKAQISLGIVFLILAFLITIQFRSVTKNNEAQQQNNLRVEDLLTEVKKEQDKNEDLQKQITAYENDIAQYRKEAEQTSGESKFLSEQLKRAEILAGMVDVKGPGITISLSDVQNRKGTTNVVEANSTLIHDEDIRRVINELAAAGAEAR